MNELTEREAQAEKMIDTYVRVSLEMAFKRFAECPGSTANFRELAMAMLVAEQWAVREVAKPGKYEAFLEAMWVAPLGEWPDSIIRLTRGMTLKELAEEVFK